MEASSEKTPVEKFQESISHTNYRKTCVEKMFTYYPRPDKAESFKRINEAAKQFALVLVEECDTSAETTLAIRKIQEARMWANASIVLQSPPPAPTEEGKVP